jgi:cysteine desulfuration protein SufE
MTLAEQEKQLSAQLAALPNVQQRLNWLVEQVRTRPPLPDALRSEAHRVPGCLARLWFVAEMQAGNCIFQSDSDCLIVKSTASLLCDFYSGHPPAEILAHDPGFLAAFGIHQHLTPNRRNALARIWTEIRSFAKVHGCGSPADPAA